MFRWLEKRSYSALINQRLAQEGCKGFYPSAVISEIVEYGLADTERHAKLSHAVGDPFSNDEFEAHFSRLVTPFLKLLSINAMFAKALKELPDLDVNEKFERHFGGGKAELMGLTAVDAELLNDLLVEHSAESHMERLSPIMFGQV